MHEAATTSLLLEWVPRLREAGLEDDAVALLETEARRPDADPILVAALEEVRASRDRARARWRTRLLQLRTRLVDTAAGKTLLVSIAVLFPLAERSAPFALLVAVRISVGALAVLFFLARLPDLAREDRRRGRHPRVYLQAPLLVVFTFVSGFFAFIALAWLVEEG